MKRIIIPIAVIITLFILASLPMLIWSSPFSENGIYLKTGQFSKDSEPKTYYFLEDTGLYTGIHSNASLIKSKYLDRENDKLIKDGLEIFTITTEGPSLILTHFSGDKKVIGEKKYNPITILRLITSDND